MQKTIIKLESAVRGISVRFTELPNNLVRETVSFSELQDVNIVFNDDKPFGKPSVLANKLATYYRHGYVETK
jgi:hypothetical protein